MDWKGLVRVLPHAVPYHLRSHASHRPSLPRHQRSRFLLEHRHSYLHPLLDVQLLSRMVRIFPSAPSLCELATDSKFSQSRRISYHLLDRVGLKLGKWIWDGLFVTKPNNAAAMPGKFARHMLDTTIHGPGRMVKGWGNSTKKNYKEFRANLHTVMNWRTPTTRPAIPAPTDPEVLAQLHSTRWTSDLTKDGEAMRTRRLLYLQSWAWIPHLFLIPGMTAIWCIYHPTGQWTYDALTFSALWRIIWVFSLPNCFFAWIGFITPDVAPTPTGMDGKKVHRDYIRNFFIVLVTKGSNEAAVRRGYNKLIKLEKYHPAVKVVVLTDEPYVYPDLQNIVCPKSYKSPLGKAKYKARALDYFRYHVSLGVYDWILHMFALPFLSSSLARANRD